MRQWSKSNISGVDNAVLRDIVQRQDTQLNELSAAMGLIKNNRQPSVITNQILGVTDHGQLTGLADDDHAQYLLLTGRSGGQALASLATEVPLTIRGGSNSFIDIQKWQDQSGTLYGAAQVRGGSPPVFVLYSDPSTNMRIVSGSPTFSGSAYPGIDIYGTGNKIQLVAATLDWATNTPALLGVDSATMSAVVSDSDDNIRIIRRSATQTGHALRLMDETRTTTLAHWAADGSLTSPSITGGTLASTSSLFLNYDSGTGFSGEIFINGGSGPTSAVQYNIPDGGGTIVVDANATLYQLYLNQASRFTANTSALGASFADTSTISKRLRFVLSGAVGNNSITINSTAARNYQTPDTAGQFVLVGNTTSAAGTLGKSDLTAQTGSIGSTTLMTGGTPTAGMYRVSAYLKTTTAGGGGAVVKMTVGWNDGAAQTADMPLITAGGGVVTNHDLTTLNAKSQGSIVLYSAASQNVTYTTTFTAGTGSPQYSIYVRIEYLG